MLQSAGILQAKYPGEFACADLIDHVDDLLFRFRNRALGDTVFRVGCDLQRKLHRNDRILSPLIDGINMKLPVSKILMTFVNGLCFRGVDENRELLPEDKEFKQALNEKGLHYVLIHYCELDPVIDLKVIKRILNKSKSLDQKHIDLK